MPKKAPKNAFYYFMADFRESERKKGINYGNMQDVAIAAGPHWRDASPEVRAKFDAIAKSEKMSKNGVQKLTNTGTPIAEIERQERELQEAMEQELKDIRNMVNLKAFGGVINNEDIYVMDVNYYCKTNNEHLIAESTILRFNMQDGICDSYHEMINIGYIPTGYAFDVKLGCEELGLEPPDDSKPVSNFMQILANIIDYLKKKDRNAKVLPPIFTLPEKIVPIQDFIVQMCRRAGEDEELFRVYQLDTLFMTLFNAVKSPDDEAMPACIALIQLKKDLFKYNPGLGCAHHEATDKSVECTSSRVKRWAFTIMDSCCNIVGIDLLPGKHLPFDFDMDKILTYKEQKKGRTATSVATMLEASACNSSMLSDSLNESQMNSTTDSERKGKRVHQPVRMPKKNSEGRRWPAAAPELTENNFPSLTGRGRGRGLALGRFNGLKLDE